MSSNQPLQKLQEEYLRLRGQLATGRITHEQFEQARAALRLRDAQGHDWGLDADGNWLMYDGRAWVRANPAQASASTPASIPEAAGATAPVLVAPTSNAAGRGLPMGLILGLGGLAAIVLLLLAIFGVALGANVLTSNSGTTSFRTPTSDVLLAGAPTAFVPASVPTDAPVQSPSPTLILAPTTTPTLIPTVALATTVPATACPKPQIASFTINPNAIKRGDTATLNWGTVTNATRAEIDQNIGGVPAPGSRQVKPDRDTTFTLTATGCGGVTTAQVSISVLAFGAGDAGIPQGPQQAQKFLQFDWSNRSSFNSDYLSGIEIQTNRGGSYQPFESASNFPDGQYTNKKAFPTDGKYKIRFRWWMIDPKTHQAVSLKSQWSVICFNYGDNEQCN